MEPEKRPRLALRCGFLALLVYLPTMGFGFVWDDAQIIGRGGWLESFSILDVFTSNAWNTSGGADHYRPFLFLSFRTDVALWGREPAGHHLTSTLIHAITVHLVAQLILMFGYGSAAATTGALLFALHPVHVESTAWVAGRTDPLASVFGFTTTLLLLRPRTAGRDALAALAFLGALFTKEVAVIFIPALLALAWAPRDPASPTPRPDARRVLLVLLPAVALYLAMRVGLAGTTRSYPFAAPQSLVEWLFVVVTDLKLAGRYLGILVLGTDYGPIPYDEGRPLMEVGLPQLHLAADAELLCALVALLAPLPFLRRMAPRHPALWFALVLGFPAVLLSMNLTTAAALFPFNDRFLFLATLTPALLGAIVVEGRGLPGPVRLVLIVTGALWLHQVLARLPRYQDMPSFCEEAVRLNPGSPIARDGLATVRAHQGRREEAAFHAEIALALRPSPERVQSAILMQLARQDLGRALEIARAHGGLRRPARVSALLSQAALRLDRVEEAASLAEEAARAPDAPAEAFIALGLVRSREQRSGEARQAYRQAIGLAPAEPIGWHNLALLEAREGDHAAAAALIAEAQKAGVAREALESIRAATTPRAP